MNPAIQKTLSLLLLIFIGFLLKSKISGKDRLSGIKILILSVALPATIFIALLKVQFTSSLIWLPLFAIGANVFLFLLARLLVPKLLGREEEQADARTLMILLPSFAPGLSCFPFITEYLGESGLALAALADVGNKVFVLVILYLIAMHFYYQTQKANLKENGHSNRLKLLLVSMVQEPVNMVILVALIMLGLGWNMSNLPRFIQDGIGKVGLLMTPLVLLFIGIAADINWRNIQKIAGFLFFRSGFAFLFSGILISVVPISDPVTLLLLVLFPQSACSFWPFAHMSAITAMEDQQKTTQNTFNLNLALNILALSLPLSTALILLICSVPTTFSQAPFVFLIGISFLLLGFLFNIRHIGQLVQQSRFKSQKEGYSQV